MDDIRCAEQALVAAVVLAPQRRREVDSWLSGSDFASATCGLIFDRLGELAAGTGEVDASQLLESFRDRGELRSDGYPVAQLLRWFDAVPPHPPVAAYGGLVLEGWSARRVEAAGTRLVQVAARGAPARAVAAAAGQRTMIAAARRRWCAVPEQVRLSPVARTAVAAQARGAVRSMPVGDVSAELVVVGSVLTAPGVVRRLSGWLQPSDFAHQHLAHAYGVAVSMAASGAPVDRITVGAELRRSAPRVGWTPLLMAAEEAVPVPSAAAFYGRQVVDAAVVRGVAETGEQLVRLGRTRPGGAAVLVEAAIAELDALAPTTRRFRQSRVGSVVRRTPELTRGVVRAPVAIRERASR